jgi:hypothetical protein
VVLIDRVAGSSEGMRDMYSGALIIFLFGVTVQQSPAPPPAVDRSTVPQCAVATDPTYGVTLSSPVQVGGGAMYGPARERRYLDALRGPDGQLVRYKRTGSTEAPDGATILDAYEVTHDGLAKPIVLYVDEYHYSELRAPAGFVCGQPIGLDVPSPDPFQTSAALISLAIEQGSVRDFPPIPLDRDGATTHGVVFDQFRMIARSARAAAAAGTRLDPKALPAEIARPRTVVLAYPLSCNGRTVAPADVEILGAQGAAVRRDGDSIRDTAIGALLPGVQAPVSSMAATFTLATLRPSDTVRITYADPSCTGGTPELALPVKFTDARTLETPVPPLPAGLAASDTPVRLQALVDLDGMLQRPAYVGGPTHLTPAAMEAIQRWRSEPPRINGAPIVRAVLVQVKFKP